MLLSSALNWVGYWILCQSHNTFSLKLTSGKKGDNAQQCDGFSPGWDTTKLKLFLLLFNLSICIPNLWEVPQRCDFSCWCPERHTAHPPAWFTYYKELEGRAFGKKKLNCMQFQARTSGLFRTIFLFRSKLEASQIFLKLFKKIIKKITGCFANGAPPLKFF